MMLIKFRRSNGSQFEHQTNEIYYIIPRDPSIPTSARIAIDIVPAIAYRS